MGNDKEEANTRFEKEDANTWLEIGFEDEAWEDEKTNPALEAMREEMREKKEGETKRKGNERKLSEWRGYYPLVSAANLVAGLPESMALRTALPSYPVWAKAASARRQAWRVSGGLTHPKDDFAIPVRQVHREEGSFVYLSDFVEWVIEAGCTVAPRAIEDARRECEVSDTFERRARLWEIDRTLAELRNSKTDKTEVILARDARIAALDREWGEIIVSLQGGDSVPEGTEDTAKAGAEKVDANNLVPVIALADHLREMILDAHGKNGSDESAIRGFIADAAQGGAQADTNRPDEHLVLKGIEPTPNRAESRAISARSGALPPLVSERCIVRPPTNKDDWFSVIDDAAQDFRAKNGRCPKNYTEMWVWLHDSPPRIYGVRSVRDGGEKALSLPGGSLLPKRSFKARWDRYTCGTKEHKET